MDHAVGRIADEIERLGIRDNTLVIVTADHGEGLGEHGEESHSFFVYDSTMRIPLVLWGADLVPRGRRAHGLVRLIDVGPTILDLVGAPLPSGIQGVSLRPILEDPDRDLTLTGYGESIEPATTFGASALRFVREGDWKYIHKLVPELYDVNADPNEKLNLADAHPEVVERLRARLVSLIESAPEKALGSEVKIDPDTLQQLHALGYVGGPAPVEFSDELAALEVRGPDPTTRIDDVWKMAVGLGYVMHERFPEAEAVLREVVERNPTSISPLQSLITAIYPQDRPDDLVPLLRRLAELDAENPAPKADLAKLLGTRGEVEEAEELFQQALLLDACAVRVRFRYSELLREQKRYAEQLAVLEAGDPDCFDSLVVHNALAYALATSPADEVRDGARALEISQRAVEESGGGHPDYLDTQACAHAELGQFEQAVALQRHTLSLLEGHDLPEVLELYSAHLARFEAGEPVREP
jgi:tetratricopeptide (TPR) repeat protein